MNRPLEQSDASYIRTLETLNNRVQVGVPLKYYDCEDIGAKNTECTLGLCDDDIQASQDGVYRKKCHVCPHDKRAFTSDGKPVAFDQKDMLSGCFWHCHIFKGKPHARQCELVAQRIFVALENAVNQGGPSKG